MRKSTLVVLLAVLLHCVPTFAATWFAQNGTGNMSTRTWNSAANGSGSPLTWASRGKNDTFDFNGQTGIVWDVDPSPTPTTLTGTVALVNGLTTLVGTGTLFNTELAANDWVYVTGAPPVQIASITNDTTAVLSTPYSGVTASGLTAFDGIVTLTNTGALTGNSTLALSAVTYHAHIKHAGSGNACVATFTGTTTGFTLYGWLFGGTATGACAISDTHTGAGVTWTGYGTCQGGTSSASAACITYQTASGTFAWNGNIKVNGAGNGINMSGSTGCTATVNGVAVGSDTSNAVGIPLSAGSTASAGAITFNGIEVWGKYGGVSAGKVYPAPTSATSTVYKPADGTYASTDIVDAGFNVKSVTNGLSVAHAAPYVSLFQSTGIGNVANVKSGVVYGPNTGTALTGGGNSGSAQ